MTNEQNQFQQEFMEMVRESAAENNISVEAELTKSFIEYIVECGDALAPEICECASIPASESKTGRYKLNAFDYSEDSGILDLFGTIYYGGQSPELPKSTAHKMVSEVSMTFQNALFGMESKRYRSNNPDVADVFDMIHDEYDKKHIELIRIFVLSNGYATDELDIANGELGMNGQKIATEYYFWDMEAIRQAELARQGNHEIIIDLKDEYQSKLECISTFDEENNITSYLAIMPALILAKIYSKYKVRLIDQNVRNFLGGKVKVNKEMADTIATRPNQFFAFNNGISSTAANVTIDTDDSGRKYITRLRNWHIVNGGQTTSTIYNALKKSRETADALQKAYVSVKISEVPAYDAQTDEKLKNLIPDIAKYANSQTKIKDSDLSANTHYMLEMQHQSETEKTPTSDPTYWYFERLRGQFLTEKSNVGGIGTQKVKIFEKERPQNQRFNKTDVAKLEMSWMQKPFIACKGGEVCFEQFWKIIKDDTPKVDSAYFHGVVAKMILYQYIDRMLKNSGNKGYAAIICNYTIALLALRSQEKLDLNYIWQNQHVQDDLKDVIKQIADTVADYLAIIGTQGSKNPQTESKKVDFWNNIQNKTLSISIPDSVLITTTENTVINPVLQAAIDEAKQWGEDNWKNLAKWANGEGKAALTIMDRKKIDHIVSIIKRNDAIKPRLASECLRIKRLADDYGFSQNRHY